MPRSTAEALYGDLGEAKPSAVIDGVLRDLEEVRGRSETLAKSSLAGTAIAMAMEIEHPFNSADGKSKCARALLDTMDKIRALLPPKQEANPIDDLRNRREKRRAATG